MNAAADMLLRGLQGDAARGWVEAAAGAVRGRTVPWLQALRATVASGRWTVPPR